MVRPANSLKVAIEGAEKVSNLIAMPFRFLPTLSELSLQLLVAPCMILAWLARLGPIDKVVIVNPSQGVGLDAKSLGNFLDRSSGPVGFACASR